MPAATTHAEFAARVYQTLSEDKQAEITSKPMYYLGSQGPDLFFFSKYMFLPGSLNPYGKRMHNEKIQEVIFFLNERASTPSLRSYVLGYLTHYALDSSCHPMINAWAKNEHETTGINETEAHFRIEGELDAWILNQSGRTVKDYSVYNLLKISKSEAEDLGRLYHSMFQEVFGLNIPASSITSACFDCARITRQLRPGKTKYGIARAVETTVHMPHLITAMMLEGKEGSVPSVLNQEHQEWVWYGTFHDSFTERMDQAETLAVQLMDEPKASLIRYTFNGIPLGETILYTRG
ncbi:MAG: zinc dependent phospholipase C family protein [Solobacterium sp.]|nr:zinc dependent phospholipase C family protein [Solobacterium sp.]